MEVDGMNLHSPGRAPAPAQLRVINVMGGLLGAFEQYYRRLKTRGLEVLARPIGAVPERAQLGFFERGKGTQVRAQRLLELRHPARERHAAELAQPLLVITDLPAPADLAVFEHPGIEDGQNHWLGVPGGAAANDFGQRLYRGATEQR